MMEAACPSETSVNIQLRTWQYIPEDSELELYFTSVFLKCNISEIYSVFIFRNGKVLSEVQEIVTA
jgi:hypothetical protein